MAWDRLVKVIVIPGAVPATTFVLGGMPETTAEQVVIAMGIMLQREERQS